MHRRLDLGGPLEAAWLLHHAWPGSQLTTAAAAGHTTDNLADHATRALDNFATAPG